MPAAPPRLTRNGRFVAVLALFIVCFSVLALLPDNKATTTPSFDDPIGQLDVSKVPYGWGPEVDAAAKVAGIPGPVLAAQLFAESKWDPKAVSPRGAQGLAQFTPDSWAMYGRGGDPFNPHDAIATQGRLMKYLKHRADTSGLSGNRVELSLAGYNAGFENVVKYRGVPPFNETQKYVKIIADAMDNYALPVSQPA